MTESRAAEFERVIGAGGVVLFPSDTVYGLACDPTSAEAVGRLYALKGRPPAKAAAVMFFDLHAALDAVPSLGPRTRALLHGLLPGPITVLVRNPDRLYPIACGEDPDTLGLRVVSVPALAGAGVAVLQSSANPSGGADARRLAEVAPAMRAGADLVIDGGELPGAASTVLDLRGFEDGGGWSIVRPGPVREAVIAAAAEADYHFEPAGYHEDVTEILHDYEELQAELVRAGAANGPVRILELGTGTGETTRRLLDALPEAALVGVDGSPAMLAAAAAVLPAERFSGRIARLQEDLPEGPFDLVASALTVHHLDPEDKADLFRRVRGVLRGGGRFVLADVVVPEDPGEAEIELTHGFDKPSGAAEQLGWLAAAGLEARVVWSRGDLVVIVADLPAGSGGTGAVREAG